MKTLIGTMPKIAIIGGGPSGLFLFKRLLETEKSDFTVDIFEAGASLGSGMPYSSAGANPEHITNVSGNEIPQLETPVVDWMKSLPADILEKFNIDINQFNDFKVLPRLLFGDYLNAQFMLLLRRAKAAGLQVFVHLNTEIADIKVENFSGKIIVETGSKEKIYFDDVIICTGHKWPVTHEGMIDGFFDSPYPPAKIKKKLDHAIAIKGGSLTAIDAIRTIARHNGTFTEQSPHKLSFQPHADAKNFKIVMHSRHGLLPCIRFHLEDSHLTNQSLLSHAEIEDHIAKNDGFLSLDFIFEKDFKDIFRAKDIDFYARIKDMRIEDFVASMMGLRNGVDPFLYFKAEYAEAQQSIRRQESVYWKEMLAVLSFAMNYPAKYLSAEDMQRLQTVLMPLISIVIAFVPQNSCEELIALHEAGCLDLVSVGMDSHITPDSQGGIVYHYIDDAGQENAIRYKTYIDCTGQRHLSIKDLPFKGLVAAGSVSPAKVKFRSRDNAITALDLGQPHIESDGRGDFFLQLPGIAISDDFEVINQQRDANPHLFMMAVPYIGGYNPDYSGLDFCAEASQRIVHSIFQRQMKKSIPVVKDAKIKNLSSAI